jgi:hypothetical protein
MSNFMGTVHSNSYNHTLQHHNIHPHTVAKRKACQSSEHKRRTIKITTRKSQRKNMVGKQSGNLEATGVKAVHYHWAHIQNP